MNINIALNTIIIIMVFLFPGVLFRKFYFSGQFGNQFEQGNLLERFLWSLFLSLICLSFVSLSFSILAYTLDLHPLSSIDFDKIAAIFKSLSKNEFPNSFSNEIEFINFLLLLFIIYFISGVLGYLIHNIIRLLSLDRFSIFKFKNNWHYLSQAYKENGINRNFGDVYTTFVDVLVKNNIKDELYRGILNNFILDKEDKLENLVLSNVYKFISVEKDDVKKISDIQESINLDQNIYTLHRDYLNRIVYKKSIDGNLLVLTKENIININLTYVKTSNRIKQWKSLFYGFLSILFVISCTGLFILLFLEIKNTYFATIWRKIFFSFTTFIVLTVLLNRASEYLDIKNSNTKSTCKDIFFILLLFSTPYLWIFNLFSGFISTIIFFIVLFTYSAFQNKNK